MPYRKDPLVNDNYYHIYSRSISKYEIFNDARDYQRMYLMLDLYQYTEFNYKFSSFLDLQPIVQNTLIENLKNKSNSYIDIIAYCLMPTHIHLILKQNIDDGISKYMKRLLDSYSKYFNIKHGRNGPLWASRFKSILVLKDKQLLHLTRYLHLNPTSANLVKNPSEWIYSSYNEYINDNSKQEKICRRNSLFDLSAKEYRKFVLNRKAYQRELSKIKNILIDDYIN